MKLVIQFFNEEDGTRSEALSGTPSDILEAISQLEESLKSQYDGYLKQVNEPADDITEDEYSSFLLASEAASDSLERFLDSFVIVILEQHSDDADDMRVSRIPILKRENFINVLKEKAQ